MTTKLEEKLKAFEVWHDGLEDLDRTNFDMLVGLPGTPKILAQMSQCEYRDMLIFALAVKQVTEKLQPEKTEETE